MYLSKIFGQLFEILKKLLYNIYVRWGKGNKALECQRHRFICQIIFLPYIIIMRKVR